MYTITEKLNYCVSIYILRVKPEVRLLRATPSFNIYWLKTIPVFHSHTYTGDPWNVSAYREPPHPVSRGTTDVV